jgi:helix-turn-helix protein
MSSRELERVEVMGRVANKSLKLLHAAEILRLSYRQVKRLWKIYRQGGAAGLKHGHAGRPSNRAKAEKFRRQVLRLVAKKYSGSEEERFGPTLAAEHLAEEDGLLIDEETLRRWMLAEGLWTRRRKRQAFRKRRERKPHFGELVQLDGSFHDWLEGRGPGGCLMDMVDDATSTVLCRLGEQETIWAAVGVLRAWIGQYGVPQALYTDWKNVYKRQPTEAERLRGEVPLTQFGRMCQRLGIEIIAASSPQAKGRVERNHGIHQDRLVKKLRRQGLTSHAAVNEYLEKEYLPAHNRRFARAAAEPEDYHRRRPGASQLRQIFRLETERRISNDWVVRHEGRLLQLQPQHRHYGPTRAKALVCEWEDGTLEVHYRGERLAYQGLAEPPRKQSLEGTGKRKVISPARRRKWKPRQDHPWRRAYGTMKPSWPAKAQMPVRMVAGMEAGL